MSSVDKPIAHERVKIRAGDAERIHYVMHLNLPKVGQTRVAGTQYYLVGPRKDLYVLTITAKLEDESKNSSTFDSVVKSFRFAGK